VYGTAVGIVIPTRRRGDGRARRLGDGRLLLPFRVEKRTRARRSALLRVSRRRAWLPRGPVIRRDFKRHRPVLAVHHTRPTTDCGTNPTGVRGQSNEVDEERPFTHFGRT